MTKEKVKEKSNIKNWGENITKDKVNDMVSMWGEMPREVAMEVVEMIPDFNKTIREVLIEYKENLNKGLESNRESVQTYYDTCNSIITALLKQLEDENLSSEEKKSIMDRMLDLEQDMKEKDT